MATNPNQANAAYNAQAVYEARAAHEARVYEAQAAYEAQVHQAQAAYDAQVNQAQAAYQAQLEAEQPIIIHTTANWFWQCHLVSTFLTPLSSVVDPRLFQTEKEVIHVTCPFTPVSWT